MLNSIFSRSFLAARLLGLSTFALTLGGAAQAQDLASPKLEVETYDQPNYITRQDDRNPARCSILISGNNDIACQSVRVTESDRTINFVFETWNDSNERLLIPLITDRRIDTMEGYILAYNLEDSQIEND